MKKYGAMAIAQMKVNFAYSAWYWAGMFSALLRVAITFYFWHAVYGERSELGSFDLETMITYAMIAMLLERFVSGIAGDLAESIQSGGVAIELMRPYDLLGKLMAFDMGNKLSSLLREAIPMALILFLFLRIQGPNDWQAGLLFLLSAVLGVLIGAIIDVCIGLLAFWTYNIFGLSMLRSAVISFFAGGLVPVTLFPGWLQTLSGFLPFQSMVYVPVAIYTGQLSGLEAWTAIGIQLFWLAAVFAVIRGFWAFALRKVTIFGG